MALSLLSLATPAVRLSRGEVAHERNARSPSQRYESGHSLARERSSQTRGGHAYFFDSRSVCWAFFSSACFFGFLTFFLPLAPMSSMSPSLFSQQHTLTLGSVAGVQSGQLIRWSMPGAPFATP